MTKKKTTKASSEQLEKLTAELAQANEARLRMAADYANLERRIEQDRARIFEASRTELLEKLFPIMDNLYRSSRYAPTISLDQGFGALGEEDFKKIANYFNGLRLIEQQLEATLSAAGLQRVTTIGAPFDHQLHEAISYEKSSTVPADHVIDEIESGWQINGKVIRPAKVRVSQG